MWEHHILHTIVHCISWEPPSKLKTVYERATFLLTLDLQWNWETRLQSPPSSWMLSAWAKSYSSPNHIIWLQVICNQMQRKTEKSQGQGQLSLVLTSCFSRWHGGSRGKYWGVHVHFTFTETGVWARSLVIARLMQMPFWSPCHCNLVSIIFFKNLLRI